MPIYIEVSDKIRLLRQLNRENNPNCAEICRRFFTDEQDFQKEKYDFDYYTFDNEKNELDISNIIDIINNGGFNIGED